MGYGVGMIDEGAKGDVSGVCDCCGGKGHHDDPAGVVRSDNVVTCGFCQGTGRRPENVVVTTVRLMKPAMLGVIERIVNPEA